MSNLVKAIQNKTKQNHRFPLLTKPYLGVISLNFYRCLFYAENRVNTLRHPEIKIPFAENPELSNVPSFQPGACQNIALHA